MRIAIYHNLPSGGGKRALYEMVKRLAANHSLDVYTLSTADTEFCDLRPYCQNYYVFPFQPLPKVRSPLGRLNKGIGSADLVRLTRVQHSIAAAIDAAAYDVVFVHNCQYSQSPALLRYVATPSVYYCAEPPRQVHEPLPLRPYNSYSKWQRIGNAFDPLPQIYKKTLIDADLRNVQAASSVLTNSAFTRETLYHVYGILARVCYLGVDVQRFRPLDLPKGNFILSVGALQAKKGFDLLIESLALIPSAQRPRLVIVSNATEQREKDFLFDLAQRCCVEVEFKTGITDDNLTELYNCALLTAYTPLMEPFGFVTIESMACGTPVVGVNEGGLRETIVNNETGLLVERNPASISDAITQLLGDEPRRIRYGANARQQVIWHWQWDCTVKQLERFLQDAALMSAKS
jgi:glycosyltransferase involved in cell wall biosynthesis